MQTMTLRSEVTDEGTIKIEVPCNLPPGPVEVVLIIQPDGGPGKGRRNWEALSGLGREVWQGVDAEQYVRELREDRETPP